MDKLTLTPRQEQVMRLLLDGATEKEIAHQLGIAPSTVKDHRMALYQKAHVATQKQLLKKYPSNLDSSTPSHSLAGYWLSRFDFENYIHAQPEQEQQYRRGVQINLEHMATYSDAYFGLKGKNMCGARSENRQSYEHEFRIRSIDQHIVGIWENSNTKNVGCFQLTVHTHSQTMYGSHLGNASNGIVRAGKWIWLRVEVPELYVPNYTKFKSFEALNSLIDSALDTGSSISLNDLFD